MFKMFLSPKEGIDVCGLAGSVLLVCCIETDAAGSVFPRRKLSDITLAACFSKQSSH